LTNINDCDPNPCQNGGSCVDGINGYTCNCAGSWTSENCTFCPIDGCKICSPVIGVCSVCFDGYLLNSNGICVKNFCESLCTSSKVDYHLRVCQYYCYLNEWYERAVQCGLSIPPVMPTDSSLSLSEQWKQLHDQLQNYQTIWFNEATSRGLTISPLQQQTTYSDLNDLWLDISQNAFSLQAVWQNHTITLQPSIELEDFTNVNRDSNNATFKSFNHLWSKDLSTFNEETDMNCQLRGT
jgi:Notch-like protein